MKYAYSCRVHGEATVEHAMNDHTERFCARLDETAAHGDEVCNEPLQRLFSVTPFIPCAGMYARGG